MTAASSPSTKKQAAAGHPPAAASPSDSNSSHTTLNSTTGEAGSATTNQAGGATTYSRIDVDELLDCIDLAELVRQAGAKLAYKYGDYRGKCPFHHGDSTTAFQIYQTESGRWLWRCHRCDIGGDAIAFVKQDQNISDFLEAVRYLADWGHIAYAEIGLAPEAQAQVAERQARTDLFDLAAQFAAAQLWSEAGREALAYARRRGFTDDLLRLAGFGFLDGSTALQEHLVEKDADLVLAHRLGLIRKDGRDFTANADGQKAAPTGWLIYAHRRYANARQKACEHEQCGQAMTWHVGDTCLRHASSLTHLRKVQYLSARALAPVDAGDKSRNLPGPRQIYRAEVPGVPAVILCEGQADAESYRQLGFTAWALCGVGRLPEADLAELRRRPVVYLALDGDAAGAAKTGSLAQEIGPLAMIVPAIDITPVTAGEADAAQVGGVAITIKDANAWLQAGATPEMVQAQLNLAEPWLDQQLAAVGKAQPHERLELTSQIVELLSLLPKELDPFYTQKALRRLGMTRTELRALTKDLSREEAEAAAEDGELPHLAKIKNGVLYFLGEPLGNFAARIVKEMILDDGLNPSQVRYTVTGQLATGETLPTIEVEAEEFAGLNWISKYWGARPILYVSGGQRHLVARATQEVSLAEMERVRVATHTGWALHNGQRTFMTNTGGITAAGLDETIRVDLDYSLRRYALPEPPSGLARFAAVKASLDFLKLGPLTVTAPLWAAIFAAPLAEIIPLYTVIWVYGSTQSGKSVIVHLVLTHFGPTFIDGRKYHAPVDWMSTATGLEELMFTAKDIPFVIDDFAPQFHSAHDARLMHKAAYQVIRATGNRSGRTRSRKYEKEQHFPRGMVISTAELPMPGESTAGRMLYVPIARGDVLPEAGEPPRAALDHAQAQAQGGTYAQAMSAYLQWLAGNWERATAKLQDIYAESLRLMSATSEIRNRLPDYFATLDAAQQLALGAFHEMGVLSATEAAKLADEISQALRETVVAQDETIAKESPVRKLVEALNSLLERKRVYFAPRTREYAYHPPAQAQLVGWTNPDDEALYLDDGAALEYVRDYWAKLGENFDTTTDALRRQISQVPGLLAEKGAGRNIPVSKWIGGKTRRALAINKRTVAAIYGVYLQNEPEQIEDAPEEGAA